jgi:PAS domain S-box-containing protein
MKRRSWVRRGGPGPLVGYAVAAATSVFALLLRLALAPLLGESSPFLVFVMPIMISAWYGGLGPGLAATVVSALFSMLFVVPPLGSLEITNAAAGAQLATFLVEGVLISSLSYALHTARGSAEASSLALQQSEARFRGAFNQAAVGIAHVGLDGRWLLVNQKLCEIVGYPREELERLTFQDITYPEDLDADLAQVQRVLAGQIQTYAIEKRYICRDRSLVWINLTVSLVRDAAGAPAYFISIVEDISDRKAAVEALRLSEQRYRSLNATLERRVRERTAELAEINQELEAFSYSIAHDLRAPLRAMEGFAAALLEDYAAELDPVAQDYAQRVVAAASQMDRLIQDLLAYSRLSRSELQIEPVSLQTVVDEALAQVDGQARERHAAIAVDAPLPEALGQRNTMTQVVTNLLANAIKFAPPDVQPRVHVWAEPRDGCVRLWVADNGIGIDRYHHERIFRVFERLHGMEIYPGAGIGLAIVRKGVERMGGQVGVESAEGKGSRFWIELHRPEDTL